MISHQSVPLAPSMEAALEEMKELITRRYPTTTFAVYQGEDPDGTYLRATVDTDDIDEVVDLYTDRLVDLQVEEGLPLFVVPVRTPERTAAILAKRPPVPYAVLAS